MSDQANQFVEYLVIGGIIDDLLGAGFSISVNNGEEAVIKRSTDRAAILAVMHETDDEYIICHGMPHNPPDGFTLHEGELFEVGRKTDIAGWVRLIYGNEAAYVLNDHSTALSTWLDANDSNYQRWFRYIDNFKWGTPSPLDAKLATMRNLLDANSAPKQCRVVFDGPPGPTAGRFIDVHNADDKSINAGTWRERPDGLWELRIDSLPPA